MRFSTSPGPDDTWESADDIVELAVPAVAAGATVSVTAERSDEAGSRPSTEKLRDFFKLLAASGLWTIRCEIPAAPATPALRDFLRDEGFRLSTERLTRTL